MTDQLSESDRLRERIALGMGWKWCLTFSGNRMLRSPDDMLYPRGAELRRELATGNEPLSGSAFLLVPKWTDDLLAAMELLEQWRKGVEKSGWSSHGQRDAAKAARMGAAAKAGGGAVVEVPGQAL